MRLAVASLWLCACDQAFGLDKIEPELDAYCSGVMFGDLEPQADFDNKVIADPTASTDLLDVVFVSSGNMTTPYELTWAHRDTTVAPFSFTPASFNSTSDDVDPSITGDGQRVIFLSSRTTTVKGPKRAYEVVRQGTAWSAPVEVKGLEGMTIGSIDLSGDGLTLYFNDAFGLQQATRPTVDDAFTIVLRPAGALPFPALSPNELEVYYHIAGSGIHRQTRASRMSSFGGDELVTVDGYDPDMPDAEQLVVHVPGNDLALLRRSCQ